MVNYLRRLNPDSYRVGRKKQKLELFVMGFPFLVLMLVFSYGPLYGWIYAFFEYKPGIPLFQSKFAGFGHFIEAVTLNNSIIKVLRNTLVLSLLNLLATPVPAILAILLSEIKNKTFRKIVQTTTTLPNFVSWVLVYAVFFFFLSSDGVLNQLLVKMGFEGETNMLGNNDIAWYLQTLIHMWKNAGWGSIIYLAAITGIDGELYDAAKVDGAGRFGLIRHITVPGMASTYIVLLLLTVCNILSNGFEQYFVFYTPLVAEHLEVLDYYVYRIGIFLNDYPLATAIGISKTLVSVVLLFIVNSIAKGLRGEAIV